MHLLSMISPGETVEVCMERDISYLELGREEKLDAYFPPASFPRPVPAVILIHGGGWQIGDKADSRERNIGRTLAANGYAVFSINYLLNEFETDPATGRRRMTRLAWPQSLYDCKSALRFVRKEAGRFGVDTRRIAVGGGSAGGHLAMMAGATARHEEFNRHGHYTDESSDVACILNFYGDYDIRGRGCSPLGGAPADVTAAHEAAASPVTWIDADTPPMFITHGTADTIIPVDRSRKLVQHLATAGLQYLYVEIAGAPHSYDLEPAAMDLRHTVLAFLGKYL